VRIYVPILLLTLLLPIITLAQRDTAVDYNISDKALHFIDKKYSKLTDAVNRQTIKLLERMQRKEDKMHKQLQAIDSNKADVLFTGAQAQYQQLKNKLQSPLNNTINPLKDYISNADSLGTAFRFLSLNNLPIPADKVEEIKKISQQVQQLQGRLQQANDLQAFLKEREGQLTAQLSQYNFSSQLLGMNKQLYYYQQQLAQYKAILHDPARLEQLLLAQISKLPAFQQFFQQNSYLSQLFGVPGGYGSPASLAGLQTRNQVQQLIGQRISSAMAGPGAITGNGQGFIQQQMQNVQGQVSQMQNSVANITRINGGSGNSNLTMPQFKPNNQKTKPFFKRFEYGFNIQTTRATSLLPSYSDIALTAGYKLNDKASAGAGVSYKLGVGRPLNHIKLSNEGAGFRTYIDVKAKGSFWLTGGMEYNYMHSFTKLTDVSRNIAAWQKSALLGITKKYSISKTKQGNLQLLYDFLSRQHVPVSQPLIFRLGYNL